MKQNKLGYYHGIVINIYIVYKLRDLGNSEDLKIRDTITPDFTAQSCLFGTIKITKNTTTSHYKYSGYGICLDSRSDFSIGNITNRKNAIIFVQTCLLVPMLTIGLTIFMFWEKTLFKE